MVYLILSWNLGYDFGDSPVKVLNANILKNDRSLREQSHVGGHLLALEITSQKGIQS